MKNSHGSQELMKFGLGDRPRNSICRKADASRFESVLAFRGSGTYPESLPIANSPRKRFTAASRAKLI